MCDLFLKKAVNCNIMVYGPTNSGKTYTMQGDENQFYDEVKLRSPAKTRRVQSRPGSSLGIARKDSPLRGESSSRIKVFSRKAANKKQHDYDDYESQSIQPPPKRLDLQIR